MSAEVLLLCLSGSLYPLALVTIIHYLGGERRIQRSLAFAAGGLAVTAVTGTLIVVLVRTAGLTKREHPTPSALFDIVVGAALVVFAAILLARARRTPAVELAADVAAQPTAHKTTGGSSRQAFVAGVAIYLPMLSYFAAVKILAGQSTGTVLTALWVLVCILVTLLVVEVAIAVAALAGERSDRLLTRMSQLVTRYTKPVLLIAGVAVGIYLIVKGLVEL